MLVTVQFEREHERHARPCCVRPGGTWVNGGVNQVPGRRLSVDHLVDPSAFPPLKRNADADGHRERHHVGSIGALSVPRSSHGIS